MIPTYLQDLAFWLPLLAVGAAWLWRRQPWGYLIAGGGLGMWAIEGLTVAVDQWFGHRADPTSDVASAEAVLPFAIATVIGIVALWAFLLHVDGRGPSNHSGRSHALGAAGAETAGAARVLGSEGRNGLRTTRGASRR